MYPYNTPYRATSAPIREDLKPERFLAELFLEAMAEEATDMQYYERLQNLAVEVEDREIIRAIRMDEQKHLKSLRDMYQMITGDVPSVVAKEKPLDNSPRDNYKKSIFDELEGMEFYRKLYFMCTIPEHRDRIFEMMTDEQNHAIKMQYLFSNTNSF